MLKNCNVFQKNNLFLFTKKPEHEIQVEELVLQYLTVTDMEGHRMRC